MLIENYGELIAQPLELGFSITLSNALHCTVLVAIKGFTVTSVIIKNINNLFFSISGVVDNAIQLLLNIKEIVIWNKKGRLGKIYFKISGQEIFRVGDIKTDSPFRTYEY